MAGMKEKYERGIWISKVPLGYDIVKSGGERKIVVNAIGKKLAKAFQWKARGMKNEEILKRLQAMGVPIYKQLLSAILHNPFYCGLIRHVMLEGQVIEGQQEKVISRELFLKVAAIHDNAKGYGVPHTKQQDEIPLKVFIKCSACDQPFTGYVVKAKNLWYYKCRTTGCKCNKSAKQMHTMFEELLEHYSIKGSYTDPLKGQMAEIWKEINQDSEEQEAALKAQLTAIEKKIEGIEEGYHLNKEMSRETFDRFYAKLSAERSEILRQIASTDKSISNPEKAIEKAMTIALELAPAWTSGDVGRKERLQNLVFPEGIVYDRENGAFRTTRVNAVIELMSSLERVSAQKETGQTGLKNRLSCFVETAGFHTRPLN